MPPPPLTSSSCPHSYVIGTEDGSLHRCSCSYNEQFLETYASHEAPVYTVQWSPIAPRAFMTCSADWSIRIWDEHGHEPLRVLQVRLVSAPCPLPSFLAASHTHTHANAQTSFLERIGSGILYKESQSHLHIYTHTHTHTHTLAHRPEQNR